MEGTKEQQFAKEVSDICNELNILDINDQDIPEGVLKRGVFDHHLEEIKEKVSNSKKMMKHKEDNFKEVQDYMLDKNVEKSRMSFRIRCEMVPEVKGNFKDKYRRKGGEDALICNDCSNNEIQTQSHCIVCPKWDCIRSGLEMNKLDDLVIFSEKNKGEVWLCMSCTLVFYCDGGDCLVIFVLLYVTRMCLIQYNTIQK